MKRRIFKRICLIGIPAGLLIALVVGIAYLRSMASERAAALDARVFITPDASGVLLVRLRPGDAGVRELFAGIADSYDAAWRARATTWDRLLQLALGFRRPSEVLTRPLPAEAAVIIRYDSRNARFHTFGACSISGLSALVRAWADNLSLLAPKTAKRYGARFHNNERLFVVDAGAGPPGPRLDRRDLNALFPPALSIDASWTVFENVLLASRRPESLALGLDQAKAAFSQSALAILDIEAPDDSDDLDARGILLNEHGELAALLPFLDDLTGQTSIAEWLTTDRALDDLATIPRVRFTADIRPGDNALIRVRMTCTNRRAATRVLVVIGGALANWAPPPPITIGVIPRLDGQEIEFRITVSKLGEYLRRQVAAQTP